MAADPYNTYRFKVEIQGITVGGFTSISGLGIKTETETFKEGGQNSFEYTFLKHTTYPQLVFKTGVMTDDMYKW